MLKTKPRPTDHPVIGPLLADASIEVMPRTAAKVSDFTAILPAGTRVYIAHIEGTGIDEMVATARRLSDGGFRVMPHFPARIIPDRATFETWLGRYRDEAGVSEALVLAGGVASPAGDLTSSMDLLETGLFDRYGYRHLHVAGHPEGNRDIDPRGGNAVVDDALAWKQRFADRTDAEMAIATQFVFEAEPVLAWIARLRAAGVTMPVHVGLAGPAKLQTLIKFAIACGVGASLKVLQRRAMDVTKLLTPYTPDALMEQFLAAEAADPRYDIAGFHIFPLGGIAASADWLRSHAA